MDESNPVALLRLRLLQAKAIDPALTFVHTLGSFTTSGNDEQIVARYGLAL
jgi:hypothetical protein